ncbi:hypothetical protein B0A48_11614 [Cryoendolithus antarcticus]|uniref:Uncharacterized protein n=1 Tax=Cryoendolithus antarcticus TaxID=1507870 RepID=A0A1V8SW26_9PEZI|nr:hypothetical protein B0A48_11614 [Cryoendolithus antarcticus]
MANVAACIIKAFRLSGDAWYQKQENERLSALNRSYKLDNQHLQAQVRQLQSQLAEQRQQTVDARTAAPNSNAKIVSLIEDLRISDDNLAILRDDSRSKAGPMDMKSSIRRSYEFLKRISPPQPSTGIDREEPLVDTAQDDAAIPAATGAAQDMAHVVSYTEPENISDLTVVEHPQHVFVPEILPVKNEPVNHCAIETADQEPKPAPLSEHSTPEYTAAALPIVAKENMSRLSRIDYKSSSDLTVAQHLRQVSHVETVGQQGKAQPQAMEVFEHQEQTHAQDAERIEHHTRAEVEDVEMSSRQEKAQSHEEQKTGQQTMAQCHEVEMPEQQEQQELACSGQQTIAQSQEVEMSDLQEDVLVPAVTMPKQRQEVLSHEVGMSGQQDSAQGIYSGQQESAQVVHVEMLEHQEKPQPRDVSHAEQEQKSEPQDVEMSGQGEKNDSQEVEMSDEEEHESPQDVGMSDQGARSGLSNSRTQDIVLITPLQSHGTSSMVLTQPDNMVLDPKPSLPPRVLGTASHRDEMIIEPTPVSTTPTPVPTLHPVAAVGDRAAPSQLNVASPAPCTVHSSRERSADTSNELPTSHAQQPEQTTSGVVDTPATLPGVVSPATETAVTSQPIVVEQKGELNEVRGGKKLKVCADEFSIRPSTMPNRPKPKAARNPGLKHAGGVFKQLECVDTVSVFKEAQKAAVDSKMSDSKEEDHDDNKAQSKEMFGEDDSDGGQDDDCGIESQSSTSGTLKPRPQSREPLDRTPHIQPRSVAVESSATKSKPTLWLPGVATGALWQNEALRGTSRPSQKHNTAGSASATTGSTTPPPPGPSYSETGKATEAQLKRWQRRKAQQDSASLPPMQCQKPAKPTMKMQICSNISAASPSVASPNAVHVPTENKGDKKRGCDDAGLEANDAAPSSAFPSSAEINTMEDVPDIQRKKWSAPARKAIGEVITPSSIPVVPFAPAERPTKIWHDPVLMPSPGEVAAAIPSEGIAYSTLWNKFEYDKVKKVYRKEADFVRFIKASRIGVITVREVDDNIAGIAMKTKKKFVMLGPGNDRLLYVAPSSAAPISVPSQWPDMPSAEAVRTALRNRPSRTMNWKMLYEMFRDQHNAEGKKLDEGQFFKYVEEERLGNVSMADYGTKAVVTYREG